MNIERRHYKRTSRPELRAAGSGRTISGAAALFNQTSQNLGGFVEQIAPGAFTRTLQTSDVVALFNHDASQILGRMSAGNLTVEERDTGLFYDVTVPNTTTGSDAAENVSAGLVTGSSFAFRAIADTWSETDQGYPLRTVTEAALFDVGPVTFPAYLQTEQGDAALAVRSFCAAHDIDPSTIPAILPDSFRDILISIDIDVNSDDEDDEMCDPDEVEPEIGAGPDDPLMGGMPAPSTNTLTIPRARLLIAEMSTRLGLPAAG